MINERPTQLVKEMNKTWLHAGMLILDNFVESISEGPTQYSIGNSMKKHQGSETFQMVHQIGGSIVDVQM